MAIQTINPNSGLNAVTQAKLASKNKLENSSQPIVPAAEDDTVNITNVAQDIKKASEAGTSEMVVNEKRVAEIKTAFEAGNYKVDPSRVAEKMLQLETKLPNST